MFPSALLDENRALFGPLCLYAPAMVGSVAVWRAFPNEPWSPDIDLVVALADRHIARSLGARDDDPRYVVDDTFIARRATRGVPLVDVLAQSARTQARPPVELLARTALALLRPGPRLSQVRCPHQIVVSFDGDVVVDGLDPEAKLRAWAPHRAHEAHVHAALLAAVAGGCATYAEAALLVEDARASSSPISTLLAAVAANDANGAVDALAALPAERGVVAGMMRGLFPERALAVDVVREEIALLDRRVLPAWVQTIEIVTEAEILEAELRERAAQCRAAMDAIERSDRFDRADPWWRRPWRTLVTVFSR